MTHLLNCPVCGYKEIEGNTCPNCDADLSLIRSLTELPALEKAGGAEEAEEAGGGKAHIKSCYLASWSCLTHLNLRYWFRNARQFSILTAAVSQKYG
jgi:hypothetical protein